MKKKGLLIINTGSGKGKTTAAIGQIIRSLGRGWRVCLIQLFKGKEFYGEQKILTRMKNLDFHSFAPRHPFCFPKVRKEAVRQQCLDAINCFKQCAQGKKKYDLIVLEEFNIALREGFLNVKELLEALDSIDTKTNIIITGRGAVKELLERADLVTEMKEIKHPFQKGVKAREGIEY